jgi:hypothetical protein
MEMTNCGFIPQAQLDFLVNEWNTPACLAKIKEKEESNGYHG